MKRSLFILFLMCGVAGAHSTGPQSGQLYTQGSGSFNTASNYSVSGTWTFTNTGTYDFAGPITATSFTADDANTASSNTIANYDNEGMAGDLTCGANGLAGELRIFDKSASTAGDNWVVCAGTTETINLSDPFTGQMESDIGVKPNCWH